jgi:hypothetical protein
VFFYKRAQIFVGDLFGAFGGQGLGAFHDIDQLTMFAGGVMQLLSLHRCSIAVVTGCACLWLRIHTYM